MRIAIVSPYDCHSPGGVNVHVTQLARELGRRGHEVVRFAPVSTQPESSPGHEFVPIGRAVPIHASGAVARVSLSPFLGPKVRQYLAEGGFDLVHIHEPLTPAVPIHFLRQAKVPTVGTFHAAYENGNPRYAVFRPVLGRWARLLDGRTAVSPAAAALARRYFPGSYALVPNGVDVQAFHRPAARPAALLPGPYVLFVSRLEKRKGLSILLDAYKRVRAVRPDIALVVVGDGPQRRDYERQVKAAGLPGVHFAGEVPNGELAGYFQHALVYCAPHIGNESFGIVLIEAMAARAPIVASNIRAFNWVLRGGEFGRLARPGDRAALANALLDLIATPAVGADMADRSARYVRQFDWSQVTDRYEMEFEAATTAHRKGPRGSMSRYS